MRQFHRCVEPTCSNPRMKRDSFIQRTAPEIDLREAHIAWLEYDADGRRDEQAFKDGFLLGRRLQS